MTITKEKAHAKLSASGSAKWLNCAGSIAAEEEVELAKLAQQDLDIKQGREPEVKINEFAELGTLAHELADICLAGGQDTIEWVDRKISCESNGKVLEIIVDEEMAKYVQQYLDYVLAHETNDSQLFTEERVDFSNLVPEGFGTMDSGILDYTTGTLHIFDLKYGLSPVVAEGNTQARLYCLGMYNELKFLDAIKTFKIHIAQPRRSSFTSEEISLEELLDFGQHVKIKARLALLKNAKRTPGEKQCEWCDARFTCGALDTFTHNLVSDDFKDLGAKDIVRLPDETKAKFKEISDDRVKELLDNKKLIEKFLKNIEEHTLERLQEGDTIPGYKLVLGRSNRKWTDDAEKALVKSLGKEGAYNQKLIAIGEAEKLVEKELIEGITYKPDGAIGLAKESDKRPAVVSVVEEFETLEG